MALVIGIALGGLVAYVTATKTAIKLDRQFIMDCRELVAVASIADMESYRDYMSAHPEAETVWRIVRAVAAVDPAEDAR